MQKRSAIPPQVIEDYWRLFVNRRAYTLQSTRAQRETGRHYYFRPSDKRTGAPLELTENTIRRHLKGEITIGLYAINPEDQCCKWVAIDADYKNAMEDLLKLQYRLGQDGVQPALEMSRRGGHLWIFLAKPLLAKHCRIYIHDVASRLGVPVKGAALREGIEIFPKQDTIGPGEFGNAIRGPLGIHRGATRRFWFYGADYTIEAQVAYLNRLRGLRSTNCKHSLQERQGRGRTVRQGRGPARRHFEAEQRGQSSEYWSTSGPFGRWDVIMLRGARRVPRLDTT